MQGVIRLDHVFQFVECTKCGIEMVGHTEAEAITAWNTRTGQLVAVSDDAIDRVVAVIRDAMMSNDYPVSEWETDLALKAIAAMKDTQPALAARGTGDE